MQMGQEVLPTGASVPVIAKRQLSTGSVLRPTIVRHRPPFPAGTISSLAGKSARGSRGRQSPKYRWAFERGIVSRSPEPRACRLASRMGCSVRWIYCGALDLLRPRCTGSYIARSVQSRATSTCSRCKVAVHYQYSRGSRTCVRPLPPWALSHPIATKRF